MDEGDEGIFYRESSQLDCDPVVEETTALEAPRIDGTGFYAMIGCLTDHH